MNENKGFCPIFNGNGNVIVMPIIIGSDIDASKIMDVIMEAVPNKIEVEGE